MDDDVCSLEPGSRIGADSLLANAPVLGAGDREIVVRLLRDACAGHGGALVLRGAPGSGRSTLLDWIGAQAAGLDTLRTAGGWAESSLPTAGLDRLLRPLGDLAGTVAAPQAELLRRVLGRAPAQPVPDPLALGQAVLELLTLAAQHRPVLCAVDDADQLDPESLRALVFAARRAEYQSLAIVFTTSDIRRARPDPLDGLPDVVLRTLDDASARTIARQQLTRGTWPQSSWPQSVPEELLTALVRVAEGNPLALVELTGSLTPAQLQGLDPPPESLPPGSRLRAAHHELLSGVDDAGRLLLLIVATAGPLPLDVLHRAADLAPAAGTMRDAVDALWSSDLLRITDAGVRVADPLLRASIQQLSLPSAQRRADQLLASAFGQEGYRLERVWHQVAADPAPSEQLLNDLQEAAAVAAAGGRHVAAARALERSAELTTRTGAAAERLVAASREAWLAGQGTRARALLDRARPLAGSAQLRGLADLLQGEIELRSGSADRAYEALRPVADGLTGPLRPQAVTALMRESEVANLAGDFDRFVALARRISQSQGAGELPETRLMFEHFAGVSACCLGRHQEARQSLRRVVELSASTHDPAALVLATVSALTLGDEVHGHTLAARAVTEARAQRDHALLPVALEYLAFTSFWRDRHAAAAAHAIEGLKLAQDGDQRNCAAAHLSILALLAASAGDRDAVLARARAAALEAQSRGLTRPDAITTWALARLALAQGHPDEAEAVIGAVEAAGPRGIHLTIQVMATPDLVEAAVRHGHQQWATGVLATFDSWAGGMQSPAMMALAQRCHGLLAQDPEEAAERFGAALRLHDLRGLRFERARTQLLYGRALRRCRRPAEARDHLRDALQLFDQMDAGPWADQTRAELRAAGGSTPAVPSAAPPAPQQMAAEQRLTPQQFQIARLVVAGATNREVAAQLFISPRTVDHHLRNIYATLGVRSRVELTRVLT